MLGDAAYDSGELREQLDERGTKPVRVAMRLKSFNLLKAASMRQRSLYRRLLKVRLARNYLASVCLAAALVWWI